MRNPINKRLKRELAKEWKKYLVLFLLMTFMIGAVSGIFVANGSMLKAIDDSYSKYNIEDGHFELDKKATEGLLKAMPDNIKIYELFNKDVTEGTGATVRLYKIRKDVNRVCVNEGRLPERSGEIAIDRMHANNRNIVIGDSIKVADKEFKVTGLIAMSDYSTLFKKSTDVMFNAVDFDVAVVTDEDWDNINANTIYTYAYEFTTKPVDTNRQKEWADDLVEKIAVTAATGGYTSDKNEAERLSDRIDELTSYLEGIDKQSKDLEARGEDLRSRQTALEGKAELIAAGDPATLAEAAKLKEDADILQQEADSLKALEPEINAKIDELEGYQKYEDDMNELKDFVPEYANQAIHFAYDDFGKDKVMMAVLVYIFIAVLAFVFAITTSNTIASEAAVIGTLRSTGYTRWELTRYYMLLPVTVTILSSIIGNILGYTIFKDAVVKMYYNSYSLVSYETVWNAEAFVNTTVIPFVLMFFINLIVIVRMMRLSPLRFLRRDLSFSKRKKAMRLPSFKFMNRFRLRILLQNAGGYVVLLFGIGFVMLLLAFAVGLPETLEHYKSSMTGNMISNYQYILKDYKDEDGKIITTSEETAEPFSTTELVTVDGVRIDESVMIYGFADNSRYIKSNLELEGQEVLISSVYAKKFKLNTGDTITLKEKYAGGRYEFTVKGIYDYPGAIAVFMPNDGFNRIFKKDSGSFTGYLSDNKIDDIDPKMIYNVVTVEDIMAVATQLDHSMGDYMDYISIACLIIGVLVIYLLTKMIIEKNAGSISMVKVLGYENREINSLYIMLTTIMVIISAVVTSLVSILGLVFIFRIIMYSMNGWFDVYISWFGVVKMILILMASYLIVSFFDMKRIKKIPLTDALKNVE